MLLFVGALFARGRRTVTSWFRAAGITTDFRSGYGTLWAAGKHARSVAWRLLVGTVLPLMRRAPGRRLLFAIDDTPTARYGPCIQGAGIHHNPSPGPAGEKFVYGHVWVTLAWLAHHSLWYTLALPLHALLYVRRQDVPALAKVYPWEFQTKLQLAVDLVRWLLTWLDRSGRTIWLAVDGAYAKRPFLKPVMALGVVVVSRLRKDAHLLTLPTTKRRRGQRGPLPTYGKSCKEPPPGRPAQRTEVVFLPGSPLRALSPATAMHLSDGLFFLVLPCSSAPPSVPPLPIPCSLFYPCTAAAAAVGATPDVFSIISSPNWRAFRFNALICFSFIWASYSS